MRAGFTDLVSWLRGKLDTYPGLTEQHLVKVAVAGVIAHVEAVDRWERLELQNPGKSAPIWLSEKDVDALLRGLRGQRGAEIRLLRGELQALLTPR